MCGESRVALNFEVPILVFWCFGAAEALVVFLFVVLASASSKPTTEFAQPRLSRVKRRSSPATGYKFGCVCSYMAGLMLCKFGRGFGAR